MKYRCLLIILFSSFLLSISVLPFRSSDFGGFPTSSIIGFTLYFFLTMYSLKKCENKLHYWQILLILIVGRWVVELPLRIIDFERTLISLPDTVIQTLGIIFGFLYWRLNNLSGILVAFFGLLIPVFMFFQGYDLWVHKLNFGTFTGKIESFNLPAKFEAFDKQKNLITDNNFQNKLVLLDFWHTRCGVCFEKFPQLQAAFEKYQNDSSIMIFAVNKPIEEDKPNQAFEMVRERNYSFPVVITKDEDLAEKFGVKSYPTTFVINRNGQIVYKGDIEGAVKMVAELKEKN